MPKRWFLAALAVLAAAAAGCGDDSGGSGGSGGGGGAGGAPPIDGLVAITVAPADQTLVIDGTTPATGAYTASGRFRDGHTEDLTTRVTFTLADPGLGTFNGPDFTSGIDHGGVTQVQAAAGSVTGLTGLTLELRERTNDPGSGSLPPNPGGLFGGPADPGRAPQLVYPNDGVLLPPNLGRLEIHFRPGGGNTLFELAFSNAATDVRVYLRCTQPTGGGCIYQPDPVVWHWIAETNRGGQRLGLTVRGTDDTGTAVGTSGSTSVAFSKDDIQGGLYYWTTSNNTGIMRFDFASTTQTMAEIFVDPSATGGTCVGCHALSHDGKKLVAEAGGQNDGRVLLLDVATRMPMVPFPAPEKSIFESWNPDGSRYVGVYGDSGASDYNLQIFDGSNGTRLLSIAGTGSSASPADHPDWSPDGRAIAFVQVGVPGTMQRMHEGAIEVITDMGAGVWSAPLEIVAREAGKNHYYPAFSPDGSFLVYDQSSCGGDPSSKDCNGDSDPTARLFAVAASGGAPIELGRANAPGVSDGANTDLTSSFPKWSPFLFQRTSEQGSRLEWVTFSSTRNYGLRNPPPGGTEEPTGTFLWMAAIDPDQVASGQDPSFPAFCLPFQDITTSNHIAQWTTKVVPPVGIAP